MPVIYKLTNRIENKSYIGFAKNFEKRMKVHEKGDSGCPLICEAIKKYGWKNFDKEIIFEHDDPIFTLKKQEPYFIKYFNTLYPFGYNKTPGGLCGIGSKPYTTEQFIEKARKIHKGKYNYHFTEYKNSQEYIFIICPKHGKFIQKPNAHLNGRGCYECGREKMRFKLMSPMRRKVEKLKGKWRLIHPKFGEYITKDLKLFCQKNNLNYNSVLVYAKKEKPYSDWIIKKYPKDYNMRDYKDEFQDRRY